MIDSFTSYEIILVVQGEDDLRGVLEVIDRASSGRRWSPTKNKNSRRVQDCTILWWNVNLVYLKVLRYK